MTSHGTTLGSVGALHRYPVKSLTGERVAELEIDRRGVVGDRLWAVTDADGKIGSGKSSRRFRRMDGLLALTARYDGTVPVLTFPDGHEVRGDEPAVHDALSEHVGRPVTLSRESAVPYFDEGPLHLVSTGALERIGDVRGGLLDARRLRPNIVVRTAAGAPVDEDWEELRVLVGDEVVLRVLYAMPRCVMLDLPAVDLPADHGLLRTVTDVNDGCLGVVADVLAPGMVRVGDPVSLLPARS